jgi:hypothetical protein
LSIHTAFILFALTSFLLCRWRPRTRQITLAAIHTFTTATRKPSASHACPCVVYFSTSCAAFETRASTCHSVTRVDVPYAQFRWFIATGPARIGQLIDTARRLSLLLPDYYKTGVPSVSLNFKSSQIPNCDRLSPRFSTLQTITFPPLDIYC